MSKKIGGGIKETLIEIVQAIQALDAYTLVAVADPGKTPADVIETRSARAKCVFSGLYPTMMILLNIDY